ncbi:MAG: glycosyltransferase, partial [bacterium]|nr:glycosyltransferase [bacterium]
EKKDAISPAIVQEFQIENNVIFLGERADVDELYPLMDIFVLPTWREGLGAAILEASAMERPVIATNVGGCPEAVDDGKTGILVPVKDQHRLLEAMVELLSDLKKAARLGKAGRQKVLKEFSENIVLKRLEDYYNNVIERKLIYKESER